MKSVIIFSQLVLLMLLQLGCSTISSKAPIHDGTDVAKVEAGIELSRRNVNRKSVSQTDSNAGTSKNNFADEQSSIQKKRDWRPEYHTVIKGDTLYAIALHYGQDYKDLAKWNQLKNPGYIVIGQRLRLFPSTDYGKDYLNENASKSESNEVSKKTFKNSAKPHDERIRWEWPVKGVISYGFGEGSKRTGLGFAGQFGDPVVASAPGKVVYSGKGLRGYGNLIIIKHNPTYLTVYAHNRQIMVKEGQAVAQGQKIAEMGKSNKKNAGLHFEIRRLGKPVDPINYLPRSNT